MRYLIGFQINVFPFYEREELAKTKIGVIGVIELARTECEDIARL